MSSKQVLGPSQFTVKLVPGIFPGANRPGRGVSQPPLSSTEVKERVELYFYSLMCLYGRL